MPGDSLSSRAEAAVFRSHPADEESLSLPEAASG